MLYLVLLALTMLCRGKKEENAIVANAIVADAIAADAITADAITADAITADVITVDADVVAILQCLLLRFF